MASRREVTLSVGKACPKCGGSGIYGRARDHRSCFWCMGHGQVTAESARRTYWWYTNHPERGVDIVVEGAPVHPPVSSTLYIRRNLDTAHIQVRVVNRHGKCVRQYSPMDNDFTWDTFFVWAEEVHLVVCKSWVKGKWATYKLEPKAKGTDVMPFPVGELDPMRKEVEVAQS